MQRCHDGRRDALPYRRQRAVWERRRDAPSEHQRLRVEVGALEDGAHAVDDRQRDGVDADAPLSVHRRVQQRGLHVAVGAGAQLVGVAYVREHRLVAVNRGQVNVRRVGDRCEEGALVAVHLESRGAAHAHDGLQALRPRQVPLEVVEHLVVVERRRERRVLIQRAAGGSCELRPRRDVHVALAHEGHVDAHLQVRRTLRERLHRRVLASQHRQLVLLTDARRVAQLERMHAHRRQRGHKRVHLPAGALHRRDRCLDRRAAAAVVTAATARPKHLRHLLQQRLQRRQVVRRQWHDHGRAVRNKRLRHVAHDEHAGRRAARPRAVELHRRVKRRDAHERALGARQRGQRFGHARRGRRERARRDRTRRGLQHEEVRVGHRRPQHVLLRRRKLDGAAEQLGPLVHVAALPVRPQVTKVGVGRGIGVATEVAHERLAARHEAHERVDVGLAAAASNRAGVAHVDHRERVVVGLRQRERAHHERDGLPRLRRQIGGERDL
mmetsp:Transcript_10330/g.31100  ORF Transcript_10330/g.31100 Transcript_10330/m.31100 type:complete len:496 (-) Transcript_10330:213-1700(-)